MGFLCKKYRLIWAVFLFVITPAPVFAGFALGASPALVEFSSQPGESSSRKITIFNNGALPVFVKSYQQDWLMGDEDDKKFLPARSTDRSLAGWMTVVPLSRKIAAGEKAEFILQLQVPKTNSGSHFGVVFFETAGEGINEQKLKQTKIQARVGVLVMHQDVVTAKAKIGIKDFSGTFAEDRPLVFNWQLMNMGSGYVLPTATVSIFSSQGRQVLVLEGQARYIFPGQKRSFSVESAALLAPNAYQAVLTIQYGEEVTAQTIPFIVN